jgi:hypothetical protein
MKNAQMERLAAEIEELRGLIDQVDRFAGAGCHVDCVVDAARVLAAARGGLARRCRLGSADRRLDAHFANVRATAAATAPRLAEITGYCATTASLIDHALADPRNRGYLASSRSALAEVIAAVSGGLAALGERDCARLAA